MEQTPTALVVNGQRDSFGAAPNMSLTYPSVFFDKGLPLRRPSLRCLEHMTWDDFFSEQLQAGEGYSYVVGAGSDVYLFEVSSGSTADKLSVKITKYR